MDISGLRLAIETSNPSASHDDHGSLALGVIEDDRLAEEIAFQALPNTSRQDVALFPCIEALLKQAGMTPRDLRTIAVSLGPGGYTSVRVGVACASSMATSLGIGCVGVPTSHVAVAGARLRGVVETDEGVCVALAGKGDTSWYALAGPHSNVPDAIGVCDSELLTERIDRAGVDVRAIVADDYWPDSHRRAIGNLGWRVGTLVLNASLCLRASCEHACVHPRDLVPIYPREPEAVKLWRARKG
ncbi:MAG: tRNA (adenosine(37)-N6)-threonylcarbamoyltransferase complex dimerization subunit type 1 TsaB [Phycisphaerales bacterium JB043]